MGNNVKFISCARNGKTFYVESEYHLSFKMLEE